MEVVITKVDERLIHGQLIKTWYAANSISHILIVDSELVEDAFMTSVYKALVPLSLRVEVLTAAGAIGFLNEHTLEEGRILLLARTLASIADLIDLGFRPERVILADRKYFPNKIPISTEDKRNINRLTELGISVVAQEFPDVEPIAISPFQLD